MIEGISAVTGDTAAGLHNIKQGRRLWDPRNAPLSALSVLRKRPRCVR
jgi:hypothetical protein